MAPRKSRTPDVLVPEDIIAMDDPKPRDSTPRSTRGRKSPRPSSMRKSPAKSKPTKSPKSPKATPNTTPKSTAKSPKSPKSPNVRNSKISTDIASAPDGKMSFRMLKEARLKKKKNIPPPVTIPLTPQQSNLSKSMRNKKVPNSADTGGKNTSKKRGRDSSSNPRRSKRARTGNGNDSGTPGSGTPGGSENPGSSSNQNNEEEEQVIVHLTPKVKVQTIFWSVPFLLILDVICEAGTDLLEMYKSYLPPASVTESKGARNSKYGMMERALGTALAEICVDLSMEFTTHRTARANVEVFRQAKKTFESKYLEGLEVLKSVRKAIGSQPSIYWYYCPETVLRILASVHSGIFTPAADELHNSMVSKYFDDEYNSHVGQVTRYLKMANAVFDVNTAVAMNEHACRSFWDVQYERGLKETRDNTDEKQPNETPRSYFFRQSCMQPEDEYRVSFIAVNGCEISVGEGEQGLREHPLSDLASEVTGYYSGFIKPELISGVHQNLTALCLELDTAMSIADHTDMPDGDNDEDKAERIYGYRDGDKYIIKPWNNFAQHANFTHQLSAVRNVLGCGNLPDNDDIKNFGKLFIFHTLVQDFNELFKTPMNSVHGILETRMAEYLYK